MASLPNPKTVTYEEWLRMPEVQDATEEVVNGEIRIMPPAKLKHMQVIAKLYDAIRSQIDQQTTLAYPAGVGVVITKVPLTSRVPDLTMFDAATIVEQDGYIHSAPQLVVEVLSPADTRRDREEKIADYARIGVPEVWVVSPEGRTVEILYLAAGDLRPAQVLREGVLTPKYFPGVQVEIVRIWPE